MYLGSKTITLPCVALEASHAFDVSPFVFLLSIIVCFSFDGAKVLLFFDIAKYLALFCAILPNFSANLTFLTVISIFS